MDKSTPPHSVSIVTASAGTGKTYELTSQIENEILAGRAPDRILASTFTIKAAEELRERVRKRLIENGNSEAAVKILGARISTINGVCGGLVKEFAFGLGLSPIVDVIDEKSSKIIFSEAADQIIGKYADELSNLATAFGHDSGFKRSDWSEEIVRIVDLARANNIPADFLDECARRSIDSILKILPDLNEGESEESLDTELRNEMQSLSSHFPDLESVAATSRSSLKYLRDTMNQWDVKDMPWSNWPKISKLKCVVPHRSLFQPMKDAANGFIRHPRLKKHLEVYITTIFKCAKEAFSAYEEHKRSRGLVDFVDQDQLTFRLLREQDLQPQLSERIEAVFIDEFQDTSPLQLANFVAMSSIAQSSIWVGDQKQAIYRFRGTDPDLITHVAPKIREATGGKESTLRKNYRSRPELVAFFNDAFGPTFRKMKLPQEATEINEIDRNGLERQGSALSIWKINSENEDDPAVIAGGVVKLLENKNKWIVDRKGMPSDLSCKDIAILCRDNETCFDVAEALSSAGLKAAIEQAGLFGTLEAHLLLMALRWCSDYQDTIALSQIAHLNHEGPTQPDWFTASFKDDRVEAISALAPVANELREIADDSIHKTPLELLDSIIGLSSIINLIKRWGNIEERYLNIDAFRLLVNEYELERQRTRSPATATDLCIWLNQQKANKPASRSDDAITVLTYHRSKGLEWPLVILTELNKDPKDSPFKLHLMSDVSGEKIDWRDPLAGRWLRYWPWPLGAQKKDVTLDVLATNSDEGREITRQEREERARLLYVGATRARDYLILAFQEPEKPQTWLDELIDEQCKPVMSFPEKDETFCYVNGIKHGVNTVYPKPLEILENITLDTAYTHSQAGIVAYGPMAIRPSDQDGNQDAEIIEEIDIGERVPFGGTPDMNMLGEAVHRFFAADNSKYSEVKRLELAQRILKSWNVIEITPDNLVKAATSFWQYIQNKWPESRIHREAPIIWRDGDRTLNGRIDAYLELDDRIIIIDHKSFPGDRSKWLDQAKKYAGQLRLYARAVSAAGNNHKKIEIFLHLPISGKMLAIK